MEPTNNDEATRTYFSTGDMRKYSPWRAPGHAKLTDPCGLDVFNLVGKNGSQLPVHKDAIDIWSSGGTAWAWWAIYANHGGGYQYRLCPRSSELTDECFETMPLEFASRDYTIRWPGSSRVDDVLQAVELSTGTKPAGSTWRRNPSPPFLSRHPSPCEEGQFPLPAPGVCGDGLASDGSTQLPNEQKYIFGEELRVPNKPGDYVLQWRWDCEESLQVWASCADIKIVASPTSV